MLSSRPYQVYSTSLWTLGVYLCSYFHSVAHEISMSMDRKQKLFKKNCDLPDESAIFIDVSSSPTYNSAVWKHFKKNKLEEKAKNS